MKKKLLKIFIKVFIGLFVIYAIYVVSNIIYANYAINIIMEAMDNYDSSMLNELTNYYDTYYLKKYIQENIGKENLKQFSYKKAKTIYFGGTVYWKYDICTADPKAVFENGTYVNELSNNFNEIYIKERQIQKKIAKKTGTYGRLTEEYDGSFGRFIPPDSFNEKAYYTLLENAVYQDENLYSGNAIKTTQIQIEYNIFTHELENIEDFLEIKHGELLIDSADELLKEKNVENRLCYSRMYKVGVKELNIITLDERFVSLYEKNEDPYVENKLEKYIIENNLSSEEIETYLINQGYIYGRCIYLENEKKDVLEVIFDKDKLLWINNEEGADFIKQKMNYFIQNNVSKNEILKELESMGYIRKEEILYANPELPDIVYVLNGENKEERFSELKEKGYIRIEEIYFYKPGFGYIVANFNDERFVNLICGNNTYLNKKGEYFLDENITKDEIINELVKDGFIVEN